MRLKEKNIIVTAAAQGIGKATALAFAKEGANVIATDINEEKLSVLSQENKNIRTELLDSTNKQKVEEFGSNIENSFSARRDKRCNLLLVHPCASPPPPSSSRCALPACLPEPRG